jgi:Domain of unknown function (DUF4265)
MNETYTHLFKIMIELEDEPWHGGGVETLWAEKCTDGANENNFKVMNSPFFARGVNFLDIVEAEPTDNNFFYKYKKHIKFCGHSTYMIIYDISSIEAEAALDKIIKIGCSYESTKYKFIDGEKWLISLDIPPETDIQAVYKFLEKTENDNIWIFQEGYAYSKTVIIT